MEEDRVVELDSQERILKMARKYVDSLELFLEENDRAVPVLQKAMKSGFRSIH